MTTFTIDGDNAITAFASAKEAEAANITNASYFGSQSELAKLTADWPVSRLVETWNSFAGVAPFDDLKPVRKFTDRKAGVVRIWTAVQRLLAAPAQQAAPNAPTKTRSKKTRTKAKRRATSRKGAVTAREGSKKAAVIELMRRKEGATLKQIMKKTGWQAHTVRGFVSGTLTKKLGLKVESFRGEDNDRTYRVTA